MSSMKQEENHHGGNPISRPEKMITVRPSLAIEVGLECSIVIGVLSDNAIEHDHVWLCLPKARIRELLPFMDDSAIRRNLKSLSDGGHIYFNSPPFGQTDTMFYSFDPDAGMQSDRSRSQQAYNKSEANNKSTIQLDWLPSKETDEYLSHAMGIPKHISEEQLLEFRLYFHSKGVLARDWNSKFIKWLSSNKRKHEADQSIFKIDNQAQVLITPNWQPDNLALDIITKERINLSFAKDCIPEFILYFQEKGEASNNWNTRFVSWVRRQWVYMSQQKTESSIPKPIDRDWRPDDQALEILDLCQIDEAFSMSLVPEFALYWSDNGAQTLSWNIKFVRHVKEKWAGRLPDRSIQTILNDTSWVE